MRRVRLFIFSTLLSFIIAPATAEGPRDLKALLPGNTRVVVEVRDAPALLKKWDASPASRFYGDPRAAAFFRALRGQVEDFQKRMGIDPDRLWNFFNGQLILAGVASGSGSKASLEWVLLARHNGDAAVLGRFQRPPAPAGTTLRRIPDKYKGLDITRLEITRAVPAAIPTPKGGKKKSRPGLPTLTAEDLGQGTRPAAGPAPLTLTKQESESYEEYLGPALMIYAGTHGQPLHRILDRLAAPAQEAGPALAGQPEFEQVLQAAGGAGDLVIYAGPGMISTAGKGSGLVNLGALGLEEIHAVAASVNLKADRVTLEAALLAPAPRLGVSRALFLPAGAAPDAAALVPREAASFSSVAIALPRLWALALETINSVSPTVFALLGAQFEGFAQQTGIKVAEGLAGRLGDGVAYFTLPAPAGGDTATWLVALRQGAAFREALKALLDYSSMLGNYHLETGKAGKWPLWTIVEGGRGTPGAASGSPLYHVCVTDAWLLAGARREGIEAAVARLEAAGGGAGSLKDQKLYQRVTAALPPDRFATFLLDKGGLCAVAQALLGSLELAAAPRGKSGKGGGSEIGLGLSASRMPAAKVWDEYFGPAALALSRQGDALLRLHAFFEYPGH